MYCSNCGAKADGKFCSNCGFHLEPTHTDSQPQTLDWTQEVQYEALLRISEVRELISRNAAMAKKGMTSEDFLALSDKLLPLFVNIGPLSLGKLAAVVIPVFSELGITTGKERSATVPNPTGTVIVAALCSLARHGQNLRGINQFDDGCLLEATLPSDMWAWEGTLYVSIRHCENLTRIDAATQINGQIFDWGKSTRTLEALLEDIELILE